MLSAYTDTAVVVVALLTGALLVWPRIARAKGWRATVTPLASIIGSGFLVLGPVLNDNFGALAPVAMAGLCLLAWAFGAAIRANIADIGAGVPAGRAVGLTETAASWCLAFAYVVSVAYYLNLFGAFAVRLLPEGLAPDARLVTSGVYLLILATGWTQGFAALEHLEQASVTLKLAIIAGLIAAMALAFGDAARAGAVVAAPPVLTGWPAVMLGFGLIVTVQGFETSRYLGENYDAATRIRTMRWAQLLSAAIYVTYVGLLAGLFAPGASPPSETAIIELMAQIAPVLPPVLVAAALAAQFSAAVADTGGAGGLFAELTRGRLGARAGYAGLVLVGLVLTWRLDVFAIIVWASRAFALYYAMQAAIAALRAMRAGRPVAMTLWWGLALLGIVIVVFGRAVEG